MYPTHDVPLPSDRPVAYPDLCPICAQREPDDEMTLYVHAHPTGWRRWLNLPRRDAGSRSIQVPVHEVCRFNWHAARRREGWAWLALLLGALAMSGLVELWHGSLRIVIAAGIACAFLLRRRLGPQEPMRLDRRDDGSIRAIITSEKYAVAFRRANDLPDSD